MKLHAEKVISVFERPTMFCFMSPQLRMNNVGSDFRMERKFIQINEQATRNVGELYIYVMQ